MCVQISTFTQSHSYLFTVQCFAEGADCTGTALGTTTAELCCTGDGFWFTNTSGCFQCIGMLGLYIPIPLYMERLYYFIAPQSYFSSSAVLHDYKVVYAGYVH